MTTDSLVKPDFSQVRPTIEARPKRMIEVTTNTEGDTVVSINSSSLSLIQSCKRKAKLYLYDGWRNKSESPALTFGSAIHAALDVFYSNPRDARTIPENFYDHASSMIHGSHAPSDHFLYKAIAEFIRVAQPLQNLPDTDKRSIANGVYILHHYFKTYITDPYEAYCDKDGPVTERAFEIEIFREPGLVVRLFGTIDLILINKANGHVLPGDHKTTSQLGSDFFNRLKPNHQYSGYLLGAREALGLDTTSFLVNGIQVKAKPLTSRGSPPQFTRQITERTPEDLEEFRQAVVTAVREYLYAARVGVWPIGNVDSCAMWGGCQFREVCASPHSLRESILKHSFQKETITKENN